MSTFPASPRSAFVEWCQAHETVFVGHAGEIGLSPEQAAAFGDATEAAAAAMIAQEAAKQAALVATREWVSALRTLRSSAGDAVRTIRAFSENSGTPLAIYNTAQISPPAQPSPAPPPAQPTGLSVALDPPTGTLTLRWKASNPAGTSGTSYLIKRRLPGGSAFGFLGVSGKKVFVDDTLPAGPEGVQYTVQGQRADVRGPVSEILTVKFGRLADGGRMVSVSANHRLETDATGLASERAVVDAIINGKAHPNAKRARERV